MKKIDTFIFVHDQNIILDFNKINKFSEFENFKYVFLGNRPCDLISNLDNVIIARNLPINIEQYPKFTSLTGWYALLNNGLIESEYVNLFEYDINYILDFNQINNELVNSNYDFIGYFPMSITDPVYLAISKYTDKLITSINKNTGINIHETFNKVLTENNRALWSSSSNSTWKVTELKKYIDWFVMFIDDIKDSEYCGHMHERSLSFFYYINDLKVKLTNNLMTHFQLNSHGTSPLPPERGVELYKQLK
jgi:hypothetical protein